MRDDLARLQAALARWPGLRADWLDEVDSTSTRLLEAVRLGGDRQPEPMLLVADRQTGGRGRQGRRWHGAAGATLMFSFARPFASADWSGLSLAVGAAIADAVEPPQAAAPRLQLKWPNDLWLADGEDRWRKLGGILVETVATGPTRVVVVGVGINVSSDSTRRLTQAVAAAGEGDEGRAGALEHGVAAVQELDARWTLAELLLVVAPALLDALDGFEAAGLAPFMASYARRDLLAGRDVTTAAFVHPATMATDGARGAAGAPPSGRALGIAPDGALRLDTGAGVVAVRSGEVRVRPLAVCPPLAGRPPAALAEPQRACAHERG